MGATAPIESLSSMPPWHKDRNPSIPIAEDEDKLPDFDAKDMLPLCYWESLYYAVVAEIHVFYLDTEKRYRHPFHRAETILHNEGHDGHNKGPVTPLLLMKVLETCWDMMMNPLLIDSLDYAVKQREAWLDKGDVPTVEEVLMQNGLANFNALSWAHIMRMLAEKYAQDVKIAVRSNVVGVPFMLDLKETMEIRLSERLEMSQQKKQLAGTSIDTNVTPRRKPVPFQHSSSNDQVRIRSELDPAIRDSTISATPGAQYLPSPATMPSAPPRESSKSLQSLRNQPVYQSSASSGNASIQRFPSFDQTQQLPSLPPQTQGEGFDLENTEDMPTIRRMRATARPATSPSTPPPERVGTIRSNTAPTGAAPFATPEPMPFGGSFDPLNPIPRTGAEQRYVSAGGHTPLHEREVMHDYFLPPLDPAENKTYSAKKEELYAQIDSREQAEHVDRVEKARKSDVSREGGRERGIFKKMFSRSHSENE